MARCGPHSACPVPGMAAVGVVLAGASVLYRGRRSYPAVEMLTHHNVEMLRHHTGLTKLEASKNRMISPCHLIEARIVATKRHFLVPIEQFSGYDRFVG